MEKLNVSGPEGVDINMNVTLIFRKYFIYHKYSGTITPSQYLSNNWNKSIFIPKTRLYKYTEKFTTKNWKFSDKKILIFFIFLLKTSIVGTR